MRWVIEKIYNPQSAEVETSSLSIFSDNPEKFDNEYSDLSELKLYFYNPRLSVVGEKAPYTL